MCAHVTGYVLFTSSHTRWAFCFAGLEAISAVQPTSSCPSTMLRFGVTWPLIESFFIIRTMSVHLLLNSAEESESVADVMCAIFVLSITDDCKKISGQVCIRVWDDGSHTYVSEPAAGAKMNCLA